MTEWTHIYRWKKHRPEWFGRPCRVVARGKRNSLLIELARPSDDAGELAVVSRFAVRKRT